MRAVSLMSLAFAFLAVGAAGSLCASTVIIDPTHSNGSFEQGGVASSADWTLTGSAYLAASVNGYTHGSDDNIGGNIIFNPGNTAPGGTVSQGFSAVAGVTYDLSFDYGLVGGSADFQQLQVDILGLTPSSTIGTATTIGAGAFTGQSSLPAYHNYSYSFTATSSAPYVLQFTDLGGNDSDGVLDNVVLTSNAAAVPLPSAVWAASTMFGGLALFGFLRRRNTAAI